MILRRLIQLLALIMIGDGVSGLLKPRWHSLLWDVGPEAFRETMDELAKNPAKARLLYAAEILVGTWRGSPPASPRKNRIWSDQGQWSFLTGNTSRGR